VKRLPCTDPGYYATPEYHGELAHVLAALGRDDESKAEYETYLESLIHRPNAASDLEIDVARYFVAQHLLKMRLPSEALATTEPSLQRPHRPDDSFGAWLRAVRAQALWQLGRLDEARQAAREAVSVESSEKKHQNIREELRDILSD
jgi:tetratricopeptide (TPR) repeat protein